MPRSPYDEGDADAAKYVAADEAYNVRANQVLGSPPCLKGTNEVDEYMRGWNEGLSKWR